MDKLPHSQDLSYFMEVAEVGQISRASERLGITQPSLTLAVKRLEEAIGVILFHRSKKGVSLTPAGQKLFSQGRILLEQWSKMKTEALSSHKYVQGTYTVGCHPSVALYSLSHFLPSLLKKHSDLHIKLFHDLSRRIMAFVIDMKIDVGIVVNPVNHPDLVIKKLCKDEVSFWVGLGSSRIQDPYSGEGILICDPELIQSQSLIKKMKRAGIRYKKILPTGNLEVVANLVAHGCGMGILPSRVAQRLPNYKLKLISKAPIFSDEVCLIYRSENRSIRAIQEIASQIKESFR